MKGDAQVEDAQLDLRYTSVTFISPKGMVRVDSTVMV